MIRTARPRAALALLICALGLILVGCSADSTSEPATLSVHKVCAQAETFITGDKPQKALDLINALRAPAIEALQEAVPLSPELQRLLGACPEQRQAALVALAKTPAAATPTPTIAESLETAWKTVNEKWFTPLLNPLLFFGVTVVVLFLVARFSTMLFRFRDLPTATAREQKRAMLLGLIGIPVSALLLTLTVAALGRAYDLELPRWFAVPSAIAAILAAAVLAIVAAGFFATFLARRLRLTIDVFDKTGNADAAAGATFAALLSELAAAPARGIEVPDSADIVALAGAALPDTPANKVVEVVKNVLIFIVTGTPWRVRVRTDAEAKRGTVTMARNGTSYLDRTIEMSSISLPKDADPVRVIQVCAAAIVVLGLKDRNEGFAGLAGTTYWLSLALTTLALSDYATDDVSGPLLLDQAVSLDPGNHLALVSRENFRRRDKVDLEGMLEYAEFLSVEASRLASMSMPSTVTLPTVVGALR
jgi:hypothetical protein